MSAGAYDFQVRHGNTIPVTWTLKDGATPIDLTGQEIVFRAVWKTTIIRKTTEDGGLAMPTPTNGQVSLTLSEEESRTVPIGALMKYELEHRVGGVETTILAGRIEGVEGVNDDV